MFKFLNPSVAPAYTVRMLLTDIQVPEGTESPKLKPFSHFTLSCTVEDEAAQVTAAFEKLANSLGGAISFKAGEVINLGSVEMPLWGVKLDLGAREEELRNVFSELFDPMMCPERNGTLYLWKPTEGQAAKCPHITIGPKDDAKELAIKLVAQGCEFIFDQVDYKKVGPQDPHISKTLTLQAPTASTSTQGYSTI